MLDMREHNLPVGTICIEEIEVGMTRSVAKTIGDREIRLFAELSTDHNPVHLDDDYARQTIFEGRIAHGILTAALISAVIGEQLPGHGTVYLKQSLRFRAPGIARCGRRGRRTTSGPAIRASTDRTRSRCRRGSSATGRRRRPTSRRSSRRSAPRRALTRPDSRASIARQFNFLCAPAFVVILRALVAPASIL